MVNLCDFDPIYIEFAIPRCDRKCKLRPSKGIYGKKLNGLN